MLNAPAVSVIIPLYNAERYIAECLESILIQNLQDFEVIIVNDCSTDSCRQIAESYLEKFSGRLKIYDNEKNSGAGAARNHGLRRASGEYIFFMDADDLIIPTALEELYNAAKDFSADVVYNELFFESNPNLSKISVKSLQKNNFVNMPTLETDDLAKRVYGIINLRYWVTPWCKLVKRDLLIEHEIFFPHIAPAEDDIWTYALVFYAKRFLRVPNTVYVWRRTELSVMRKNRSPQEILNFWINPIIFGIKTLDNFMNQIEFFQKNPQYRCAVLEFFVHSKVAQIFEASLNLSIPEIYASIENEFGKSLGEHDVLISWLLTDLIIQQKNFVQLKNN